MITVIIAAAGSGTRAGGDIPKQFVKVDGKQIVAHTLDKFLNCKNVDNIFVAVSKDRIEECKKLVETSKKVYVVEGGQNRNQTLFLAIEKAVEVCKLTRNDIIITHDAVRPFVDLQTIQDCISALDKYDVCTAVRPATDTIIFGNGEIATDFADRSKLYHCLTPQCFRLEAFFNMTKKVSEKEKAEASDICKLFFCCGYKIKLVSCNEKNQKITYPQDLSEAKIIFSQKK